MNKLHLHAPSGKEVLCNFIRVHSLPPLICRQCLALASLFETLGSLWAHPARQICISNENKGNKASAKVTASDGGGGKVRVHGITHVAEREMRKEVIPRQVSPPPAGSEGKGWRNNAGVRPVLFCALQGGCVGLSCALPGGLVLLL